MPKDVGHSVLCLSHPNAHPLKSCSLTFWPRNSRNSTKAGLSSLVLKSSSSEVWGHTEGIGHGTGAPERPRSLHLRKGWKEDPWQSLSSWETESPGEVPDTPSGGWGSKEEEVSTPAQASDK